jgi:hypothetical protein
MSMHKHLVAALQGHEPIYPVWVPDAGEAVAEFPLINGE